jgi:hypothetical protein
MLLIQGAKSAGDERARAKRSNLQWLVLTGKRAHRPGSARPGPRLVPAARLASGLRGRLLTRAEETAQQVRL